MSVIKIPGLLSLAKRAGKVISGEENVKNAIRHKKAYLVLIAEDASDNTKKSIENSCAYYNVEYFFLGTKQTLANAIGNEQNAVLCICDKNFSDGIKKAITANINGGEVL